MRPGVRIFSTLAALCALLPVAASAQEPSQADFENADKYDFDLFSATGPALVSLDAAARRASAPAARSEFSIDTGDGKFAAGNRIGAAFSVMPYWVGDRRLTLQQYREETGTFERIFARAQASAGIARIAFDGEHAWRFAAAMQTELLDAQDHRYDRAAYACLHEAWDRLQRGQHETLAQELARAFAEDEDADLEALQEEGLKVMGSGDYERARKQCRDEGVQRLLGKPSWLVGAGVGWRSDPGAFGGFSYDGASAWTQYRQPLSADGRFAVFAFARGDLGRRVDLGAAAPIEADSYEAGGGGAFQSPHFRLDLSAAYNRRDFDGALAGDDFIRYSATADIRLLEGLWLEAFIGANDGSRYSDGVFGGGKLMVSWDRWLKKLR